MKFVLFVKVNEAIKGSVIIEGAGLSAYIHGLLVNNDCEVTVLEPIEPEASGN